MTTISKSLLNGLPIKKSRIQVFEILNQNPHGLSADSIYAQLKNEYKITLGPFTEFYLNLKIVNSSKECFWEKVKVFINSEKTK